MKKFLVMVAMVAILFSSCSNEYKIKHEAAKQLKEMVLVPSSFKVLKSEISYSEETNTPYKIVVTFTSKNRLGVDIKDEAEFYINDDMSLDFGILKSEYEEGLRRIEFQRQLNNSLPKDSKEYYERLLH